MNNAEPAVLGETARAKVNLYLHILDRRGDGYHLLDSLIGFALLGDDLTATRADDVQLAVDGPFASSITTQNIVLAAAHALAEKTKPASGAALTLTKRLPVAAGIGGGSANAAAALRLLARLWNGTLSEKEQDALALSLGADVPACLRSRTLYAGGIGERIEPGPQLPQMPVVLVHPGLPLLTADVFAAYLGPFSDPPPHPSGFASLSELAGYLRETKNDLQAAAIRRLPQVETVLQALAAQPGCLLSRMSGSGATCFGMFASDAAAKAAASDLRQREPGWWAEPTSIR